MDITGTELFDSLLDVDIGDKVHDLHNDFLLNRIEVDLDSLVVELIGRDRKATVRIEFKDIKSLECRLRFEEGILDNFHRARIEDQGLLYDEVEGRTCFILEFVDGGLVQLLCRRAELTIIDN